MQRLVFACAVALFAITSYRWIIVNAQLEDPAARSADVTVAGGNTTSKPGASSNTTTGVPIAAGPNLTCPTGTDLPSPGSNCLQTIPRDTNGVSTVSVSDCKVVDGGKDTCQCSKMDYQGETYQNVSTSKMVYLAFDTCKQLGASKCFGCVNFDSNNTVTAAPKKGTGGASNVATNLFLLMSVLFPLVAKVLQ